MRDLAWFCAGALVGSVITVVALLLVSLEEDLRRES